MSIVAPIDREVLALDEAKPPKSIERREPMGRIPWTDGHAAEAISPARFLRPRCERPRSRRTTDKRDEIAPPHGLPFNEPEDTLAHRGQERCFASQQNRPLMSDKGQSRRMWSACFSAACPLLPESDS
jgi:hypothetical protein